LDENFKIDKKKQLMPDDMLGALSKREQVELFQHTTITKNVVDPEQLESGYGEQ